MQILQEGMKSRLLSPLQPRLLLHFFLFQSSHVLPTLQKPFDLQALAQVVSITCDIFLSDRVPANLRCPSPQSNFQIRRLTPGPSPSVGVLPAFLPDVSRALGFHFCSWSSPQVLHQRVCRWVGVSQRTALEDDEPGLRLLCSPSPPSRRS